MVVYCHVNQATGFINIGCNMIKKTLLICGALIFSPALLAETQVSDVEMKASKIYEYRAANTPVNYSFIQVGGGAKYYDDIDEEFVVGRISGQRLMNEHFIIKAGYQAEFLGEYLDSNISYHLNRANMGLGFRFAIFSRTDIELQSQMIYNWDDGSLSDDVEQRDLGGLVGIAINQNFGGLSEATLGANYKSEFDEQTAQVYFSFTQYINKYVGIGFDGNTSDNDGSFGDVGYVGLHVNLAWY